MGPRQRIFAAAVCIGFLAVCCANTTGGGDGKTVVCYWQSWSHKRPGPYTYNVDNIPFHLCTHVIYAYAKLNNDATSLYLDEDFDDGPSGYRHLIDNKRRYPSVKLLLALGDRYGSDLAAWKENLDNPAKQFKVLKLLYQLLRKYYFDGVHINWERPPEVDGVRVAGPTDTSFQKFTWQLKQTFNRRQPFIVSCVVSLPLLNWNASQDSWIKGVQQYMDFLHVSSRSLSLGGDINAPISERTNSNKTELLRPSSHDDLVSGIPYLEQLGVPRSKLLLEIQFSGLNDPPLSGSIQTTSPLTIGRKEDLVPYYKISELIRNGVPIHWDDTIKSPYIILETGRRLHYEDPDTVRRKVTQARSLGLTGVVAWTVDMDNFNDEKSRKNDLLQSIAESFNALIQATELSTNQESLSGSSSEGTTPMLDQNITTTHESSSDSLYVGTTHVFVSDESVTAGTPRYFDETTLEAQDDQQTIITLNSSHPGSGLTSENLSTENNANTEWNATSVYEPTHEDYTTTDDYFSSRKTETTMHEDNKTAFTTSPDDGFTTGYPRTENRTNNEWNETSEHERTHEDYIRTSNDIPVRTTEATVYEENVTAFTSSPADEFTTGYLRTENRTNDEWNETSDYDTMHEATTDEYFAVTTTEASVHEENVTVLTSPNYDGFTTEYLRRENRTNNEWNGTSEYEPTQEVYTATSDYLPVRTSETSVHEENVTEIDSSPDDDFTTGYLRTENRTNDERNETSYYDTMHEATTDEYFAVTTTEASVHEENATVLTSPNDDGFTTEYLRRENRTNNEWNGTSEYEPTQEVYTATSDYLPVRTSETSVHEENVTEIDSSPDDDFTTGYLRTENRTNDERNETSYYDTTHEATTDEDFAVTTTEASAHEETVTVLTSPHDDGFTTEYLRRENRTNNERNGTSEYEPTQEVYTATSDYLPVRTSKTSVHEENVTEIDSSRDDGFTTGYLRTENGTHDEWNATSVHEPTYEDNTTSSDYLSVRTTEASLHEENGTAFTSSLYDHFTTGDFRKENDTYIDWNATAKYAPTHEDYTTTDDYLPGITTETSVHEEDVTAFIPAHDDDFTTGDFRKENGTSDEKDATSVTEPSHKNYATSGNYFPARTTETSVHEENVTGFPSSHDDAFATGYFRTENNTNDEWNATSLYDRTHEDYTTTEDYLPVRKTETSLHEENTTTITSSYGDGFTTEYFSTENKTNDELNATSELEPTHEDLTTTDYNFQEITTTAVASTTNLALNKDEENSDWRCKNTTVTRVPHESDGEFFYRCYNGMALLRKCAQGQRFNITLRRCNVVPPEHGNISVAEQSPLSHILMKFFGDLASGKARLGKDEKLDVNVNYSFSLKGRK